MPWPSGPTFRRSAERSATKVVQPADEPQQTDVAIVGAGIVGIAAASLLQDDGRSVLLIDRGEVARGASFGNAGAFAFAEILPLASPGVMRKAPRWLLDPLGPLSIPPGYLPGIAPWLWRFWRASRPERVRRSVLAQIELMRLAAEEMRRLVEASNLASTVSSDGSLDLYESEAAFRAALPGWATRARAGIPFEHVTGGAIEALQPGLSPRFRHATFTPVGQTVSDPYAFATALADRVERRGGRILRAEVANVAPAEGGATLRLGDGRALDARKVLIAAGAWSKPLAARLGDPVPLETERGYNTTLPSDAFDLKRQLCFGDHGFVVTRLTTGIRVGGAVELGGLKTPPNFKRSDAMLAKAKAFMPGLETAGGRQWMGFRPSMPDSLPVIGRSRASPDIVYAFGHGHLGLTQSAATGRLVADLVAGRMPAIPLEPFRAGRF